MNPKQEAGERLVERLREHARKDSRGCTPLLLRAADTIEALEKRPALKHLEQIEYELGEGDCGHAQTVRRQGIEGLVRDLELRAVQAEKRLAEVEGALRQRLLSDAVVDRFGTAAMLAADRPGADEVAEALEKLFMDTIEAALSDNQDEGDKR